jgi:hypothetical protein
MGEGNDDDIQLLSYPDRNGEENRDESNHYRFAKSEKRIDKAVSVGSSLSYRAFESLTTEA